MGKGKNNNTGNNANANANKDGNGNNASAKANNSNGKKVVKSSQNIGQKAKNTTIVARRVEISTGSTPKKKAAAAIIKPGAPVVGKANSATGGVGPKKVKIIAAAAVSPRTSRRNENKQAQQKIIQPGTAAAVALEFKRSSAKANGAATAVKTTLTPKPSNQQQQQQQQQKLARVHPITVIPTQQYQQQQKLLQQQFSHVQPRSSNALQTARSIAANPAHSSQREVEELLSAYEKGWLEEGRFIELLGKYIF